MVVVTGGTGLVGSHLLCELVRHHDHIIAGFRTEEKINQVRQVFQYYFQNIFEEYWVKVRWEKIDILDIISLDDWINEGDEVYHCAALVSFHRRDFYQLMKVNREGTFNVVNTCLDKKVRKLCYVSSTAAIGGGQSGSLNEATKWKKSTRTSAYSISKYSAEKEVWRGIEEGLNAVMVNPCVILGAGSWQDGSMAIFGTIARGLPFYTPGANATVDARDVAKIMVRLMESDVSSERFLVVGSNQSFRLLFNAIAKTLGKKPPTFKITAFWLRTIAAFSSLISFVISKNVGLSRDAANSAIGITSYDAQKIEALLDYEFIGLEASIQNAIDGRLDS